MHFQKNFLSFCSRYGRNVCECRKHHDQKLHSYCSYQRAALKILRNHFKRPTENEAKARTGDDHGIQVTKDIRLSSITRLLNEPIPLIKAEDRLSRNLDNRDLTGTINNQICWLATPIELSNYSWNWCQYRATTVGRTSSRRTCNAEVAAHLAGGATKSVIFTTIKISQRWMLPVPNIFVFLFTQL